MSNPVNHFYEFGSFRVDTVRRLLLKEESVIALTPKVFDTLLVMVGSGGRVLEKDELMRVVWGGSIVEEVGLAKNVSALRKALGESPDQHRYIVTVPGRGYRFVAEVRTVSGAHDGAVLLTDTSPRKFDLEQGSSETAVPSASPPVRRTWIKRAAVLTALLLVLAGAAVWIFRGRAALKQEDTVVLADFDNKTGDIVFDEALKQGLAVQLEQSPFLNIVPDARVQETLRLMARPADQRVTREMARQVCERLGAKALIAGSIAPFGTHYAISLEAMDGHTGQTLARAQVEAERKEEVLKALSQAASRLRTKLGESIGSIQKYDALLEVTTPSLEALQAYSLGDRERRHGAWQDAAPFYHRAAELDANFAYAYAGLASVYRNQHSRTVAREFAAKAYALSDRVSERERLLLSSYYHEYVTGELDKQIEVLKLYTRIYPRDAAAHNNLSIVYADTGQLKDAVDESRIAMQLDPHSANRYANLGLHLLKEGSFSEAADVFQQAIAQHLDDKAIHHGLFRLALIRNDSAAMEKEARVAGGHQALEWRSERAASLGQYRRSVEYAWGATDEAATAARKNPAANEVAAIYASEAALRAATFRRCSDADGLIRRALAFDQDQVSLSRLALASALCGNTGNSGDFSGELGRSYPRSTLVNGIWLPVIRAAAQLQHGDAADVIESLAATQKYEASAFFWPQYLRGAAYLQLGKGAESAAEFRKIRDHQGQFVPSILYSLAQLGLARALNMAHQRPSAKEAYHAFLTEWNGADTDLPPLIEARAESDRLQ